MDKITLEIKYLIIPLLCIVVLLNQCSLDGDIRLGKGYVFYKTNKFISSTDGIYGEIPSEVVCFNYDKKHIIALQKPRENDPNKLLYDYEYNYHLGYDVVYYWIILKNSKKVLGPLSVEEYLWEKEKHKVLIDF